MKSVGIGQIVVAEDPDEIVGMLGLGSCVGVFCAVPGRLVAAAHVLLPDSEGKKAGALGKYADTAVAELVRILQDHPRVLTSAVRVSLAGGGQVLTFSDQRPEFEIGRRNADAVRSLLAKHRLRVVEDLTGGTSAASVKMRVSTGTFEGSKLSAA